MCHKSFTLLILIILINCYELRAIYADQEYVMDQRQLGSKNVHFGLKNLLLMLPMQMEDVADWEEASEKNEVTESLLDLLGTKLICY